MVVIRLSRGGVKNRPFYQIIVADRRKPRDGRFIEKVGYFNPIATGGETKLHLDMDRVNVWLNNGAQPSERVSFLMNEFIAAQSAAASDNQATA